jgi:hypothetical protein
MLSNRYPTTNPWGTGIPGAPVTIIETNNTLNHPTGPEYQFSVGEGMCMRGMQELHVNAHAGAVVLTVLSRSGTYTLKEDLHLATPPPHPSEPPITNINPLSIQPHPVIAGTKISIVESKSGDNTLPLHRNVNITSTKDTQNSATDSQISADTDERSSNDKTNTSGSLGSRKGDYTGEKFGDGNTSLAPLSGKSIRKKPKNSIAKSNSSFVSRIITHELLTKRLAERNQDDLMVFANVNRAFNWLDLGSPIKV